MTDIRLRYQTLEFDSCDIHLRSLRDKQQFFDPLGEAEAMGISSAQWPLFGVLWPSEEVLAREIQALDVQGKRVLEVGCGIGLASLVLKAKGADVVATDCHPEAGRFLDENARLNDLRPIPFLRTNWRDDYQGLGQFDLIIGSDLLYEQPSIELLAQFIHRHANPGCEAIMIDPGRRHHARFSKRMVELGWDHSQEKVEPVESEDPPYKGVLLKYVFG